MDLAATHTEFTALRRSTAKCDKCDKKGHPLINKCTVCVQHLCSQCLDSGASPNHMRSLDEAAKAAAKEAEVQAAVPKRKAKKIKSEFPIPDQQNLVKPPAAKKTLAPQPSVFANSPTKYLQETSANGTFPAQSRPRRLQLKPVRVRISHSHTEEPSETEYGEIVLRKWNMPAGAKIEGGVYVVDAGSDSDSARTIDDAVDRGESRGQNEIQSWEVSDPFVARKPCKAANVRTQPRPNAPFSPLMTDADVTRIIPGPSLQIGPRKPEITTAANTLRALAVKLTRKAGVAWPDQVAEMRAPTKRKKLTAGSLSTSGRTIAARPPVTPKRGHYWDPVRDASPLQPLQTPISGPDVQVQEFAVSYEQNAPGGKKAPRGSSQMTKYLYASNNRYKNDGYGVDTLLAAAEHEAG